DPAERIRPLLGYGLAFVGFITLVAAQYRTGYVAFVLGLGAFLVLRRRWGLIGLLSVGTAAILITTPSLISKAEPYALRGATVQEASSLDSRVMWWGLALRVREEAPIIGRGLLTATP